MTKTTAVAILLGLTAILPLTASAGTFSQANRL